jgi:outer membrane protein
MKKIIATAVLLMSSLTALAAGKIAVVDFEKAIMNTDFAQAQIATVEEDASFKANIAEVKKIQEDGMKLAQKYQKEAPTMSSTQKLQLENQIKEKQSDLEHIAKKLQETRAILMNQVLEEMQEIASQAAKELIEAEGIGLLLNGSPQIIVHSDTSFDVTAKLTERINRIHSKKKKK